MNDPFQKKLFTLYSILLFISILITGVTLQKIQLYKIIKEVKAEGIDYDRFREMKIPNKKTSDEKLTMSMMVKQYDLINHRLLSSFGTKCFTKYVSDTSSYQELKDYYHSILHDIVCFPVENREGKFSVTYMDSWSSFRSYGGKRRHEGTDLMAVVNKRGYYKVISMTNGVVEKMGWLNQGGYRIGIRASEGAYFYYAHLDSYAPDMKVGVAVKAGQFLGYMGDSGYGKEGTKGKFDVHLHVGIYVQSESLGEFSVNPYYILRYIENE